ncbi:MAG TPA: anti-anti-sigma factor [Sutterella sp.]|nr:anti-anti-sigma factor [Sutterella sp.]
MKLTAREIGIDAIMALKDKLDAAVASGDATLEFAPQTQGKSALLALILHWIREAKEHGLTPEISNLPEDVRVLAQVYGIYDEIAGYLKKAR